MNKVHRLNDVQWYIREIKKILVNGHVLPKNVDKYYNRDVQYINDYLCNLGISLNNFSNVRGDSIFENFIIAEYSDLKQIIKSVTYNKNDTIPQKILKIYNKFSAKNINNLIVDKMGVKVCPYCNENYILNRGSKRTSAQLDHFYNKSQNPLFAICLYNLIPVCAACNHIKHTNQLNISPFDEDIDRKSLKISYNFINSSYLEDKNSVEVIFKPEGNSGKQIYDDIKRLNIHESYKFHNDYLQEILKKRIIYTNSQIIELYDSFPRLFKNKEELIRIAFGNYIELDDLNKRPLSKLTRDILKELEIDIKI